MEITGNAEFHTAAIFGDPQLFGAIGLLGAGLYLLSYTLMQLGVLRGASVPHTSMNMAAAACVLISLQQNFNLSSAIIQISWIVISVIGLTRLYFINKWTHFDALELVFIKTKLAGLSKDQARNFLKMGEWKKGHTGDVLATQGEKIGQLFYIAEGHADVLIDGKPVAECEAGDFVGEITYLSGQPATGTVVLSGPATYFCVQADKVRGLARKNANLHAEIEKSIANDLRHKLVRHGQRNRDVTLVELAAE